MSLQNISQQNISHQNTSQQNTSQQNTSQQSLAHPTHNLHSTFHNLYSELIDTIFSYLDPLQIMMVQKKYYKRYHCLLKSRVNFIKNNYENYIRNLIEKDHCFVFQQVLHENADKWLYYKNIVYKSNLYSNYIYFILHYCAENNAEECLRIMNHYLEMKGLSQNRHKKNTTTNIRWKTLL